MMIFPLNKLQSLGGHPPFSDTPRDVLSKPMAGHSGVKVNLGTPSHTKIAGIYGFGFHPKNGVLYSYTVTHMVTVGLDSSPKIVAELSPPPDDHPGVNGLLGNHHASPWVQSHVTPWRHA